MSLTPMYDNIIVKAIEVEEMTAGGIYMPGADNSKPYSEGVVVECGIGYKSPDGSIIPLKVKVGDTVIYRKGVEMPVSVRGVEYLLFSEGVVIAVKN